MSVIPASFRQRVRSSIERPVAGFFGRLGFSPNALTVVGLGIAVVGAYFASQQSWLPAGLIVGFGAIFDLFDGALARATGKVSKFGAFLDSTLDRVGEAAVYIGLLGGLQGMGLAFGPQLAITALAASFMVSYTRARAEGLGFASGSGFASVGLAPREVRTAIVTVALIIAGLIPVPQEPAIPAAQAIPLSWFALIFGLGLVTILSTITAIQRILFTHNQSRSQTQEVSK